MTLKDSLGNQITGGGETVAITSTAGTFVSSVQDNGDGTYSRTIRAPIIAGTATFAASVGGAALTNSATLTFAPGPADLSQSTITATPGSVFPNGTNTTTVTMILRDANNNILTASGGTATLSATAGAWSGPIVDNHDGTYPRR